MYWKYKEKNMASTTMMEAIDNLASVIEKQTLLLQMQMQMQTAKDTKAETSTSETKEKSTNEKQAEKSSIMTDALKTGASGVMSMANMPIPHPAMAAMMQGLDAAKNLFGAPEGTPSRWALEGAKYVKPREEMTQMAENIGMSGKVMSEEFYGMSFETKKAQREAIEQNVKNMQMATSLTPTIERDAQSLTNSMYEMYEKLLGSIDGLYNKITLLGS